MTNIPGINSKQAAALHNRPHGTLIEGINSAAGDDRLSHLRQRHR